MLCLLVAVPAAWAQNVIFVKSGVTDGETITVGSETGKAYNTVRAAVDNASVGDIVKLTEDVTEEGTKGNPYGVCVAIIDRITIDGNNHSITGTGMSGSYTSVFYFKGGTIKNFSKITGGFRTIFSGGAFTADTYIDNCVIDAGSGAYPFNTDAANINYSVTITNCEINGWCSYTGDFKSFTISNTTFGQGTSGYAYFRPYSPTLLSDVTFDNSGSEGYAVDARQDRIVFNNCDVAGTTVTTENITTLLGSNSINKAVIAEGTYSADAEGRITGGIYGGNLDQLNQILAPGHVAMPLGTTPETYQVEPVYYVHFNAGGGTGTHGDSIVLRSNPTFTVPANTQFSYGTYAFLNWNSKMYGAGTDIAVNSTMNLTSDTTLYAEWDLNFVAKIGDNTYGTLQAALDDANANMTGNQTIDIVADITGYSIVHQKAGLNLTINGNDHTCAGQIIIDGDGRSGGTETLTIQNINFQDDGTNFCSGLDGFIMVPSTKTSGKPYYTGKYNYAHNVTIDNCDFASTSASLDVVGIKATSGATWYNATISNCTGDNLHSLAQLTATEGATIDHCSATTTGSFVNVSGGSQTMTISNCTFTGVDPSDGYAVRENGNSTTEINLSNNTFEAFHVLQLGKGSSSQAKGHINVESGTYNGVLYQDSYSVSTSSFVFTGGTYNEPVATVQGYCADGYMAIDEDPTPGYCTVKKMYVVTFDNNGGSGTMDPASVNPGTGAFVVPACTFTNGDWAFDKWNTKADGTGTDLVENDPMTLTSDTTLYAQWRGVAKIGDTHYTTLNAAAAAVPVGTPTTIEILTNLNFYDIAGGNLTDKTITFTGVATDTLTLTNSAHAQTTASGADLTFENITLKNDMSEGYRGIIHLNTLTINNCEVLGCMYGYAQTWICNNCTFTKTGKYHLWTYGSNCTFNNCTFNSIGNSDCKAVNVYTDQTYDMRVITFNDCAFNSTPAVTTLDNSAIQINSRYTCFVVYVNNCTVNGYINQSATAVPECPNLVNNKKEVTNTKTTLYLDGVQILKEGSCDPVAKIGDTHYQTLQAALDAAHGMTGDVTIEILRNFEEDATILQKAGLNYTIEGNNDTLNGRILVDGGRIFPNPVGEVTITNLNFTYNTSLTYGDATKGFICNSTNNLSYAAHVTVSNCTFDGGATGISGGMAAYRDPAGAQSWDITLDHLVAKNCHSLVQATSVSGMVITNCTAIDNVKNGINISGGGSDHIPGVTNVYTITNDTLACNADGDYSIRIQEHGRATDTFNLADNLFTAPKAIISKHNTACVIAAASGLYDGKISVESSDAATFSFTGGTFTNLGGADDAADSTSVKEKCATGYGCYKDVVGYPAGWTVLKQFVVTYDANGGNGSMEPSYVAPFPNTSFTTKNNEFTWGTNFTNWNTKADGTGDTYAEGDPMTISSDTTLYAQWNIVAKIGTNVYPTLQAAVDSANKNMTGDVTIELMQNTSEYVEVLQKNTNNLIINGNGNTLDGQMLISAKGENWDGTDYITVTNLNFTYNATYFDGDVTDPNNEMGLLTFCKNCGSDRIRSTVNYAHNVTISNCNFDADGSNQGAYAIASVAGSVNHLVIDNCTAKNAKALASLQSDPQFVLTNCSTEDVKYGIRIVNNDGPMTVTGNNFTADEAGILIEYMTSGATINFANDTVNAPKAFEIASTSTSGTLDITSGMYIGDIDDNATSDFFNISGGTYSENVTGEACAPGYAAFANGTTPETWTVTKAWFLRYDPNGGTGHMDSSYVKQEASADHNVTLKDNEFQNGFNAFTTWNTKADGMGDDHDAGTTMEITCDTVVYAQWKPAKVMNVTKNMGYLTVKDAAAAAAAGDTLELLMDLAEPAEVAVFANPVVFDLKGYTLTVSVNEGLTFSNATDTVKVVNGHLTNASDALDIITANHGTVLLGEGLTAESNSSILWAYNEGQVIVDIDNNTMNTTSTQYALASAQGENAKIKVESGKLNAADINVFAATDKSVVEINGGELTSENYTAGYSTGEGEIVVNGGKITSAMSAVVARSIYSTTAGSVTVNGGEITSVNGAAVHVAEDAGAAATITGGTLKSTNSYGVKCANGGSVTISGNAIVKGATYGVDLAEGNVTIINDTTTVILRPIIVGGDSSINVVSGTMLISGGIFSNNVADVDDNTLTPAYTGIYSTNYLANGLGTMIIEDATNSIRTDNYMWQVEPMDTVKITGSTYTFFYLGTEIVVPTAADDPGFTAMKGTDDVTAQVTLKTGYEVKAQGTNAGEYPMNLNAGWFKAVDQPNVGPFVFTIAEDGKLNINKRKLDLTFDNGSYDTTMSFYNGHVFTVDYTHLVEVDHGPITPTDHGFGLVNGDAITGGKFTTNDSVAGTYPVKVASFTLNPDEFEAVMSDFAIENGGTSVIRNYTPMFGQTGTQLNLIIAQRPLTITVEGTKPYDGKTFGYMSSSFPKHGDDGITITGETPIYADGDTLTAYTLMKGTEVFADTCPGIYAVTVDPASVVITNADNRDVTTSYDITIVDGNDTITTFYNCGAGYDVVYEGVTYQTVLIGSQCWMTENLRVDKGTNKIYGDEAANETKFGRLYTWYTAAGSATESDADVSDVETEPCMGDFIQGLCPDGWALPSSADFTELRSVATTDLLRDPSNDYWVEGKQGVAAGNTGFQSRGAGHYTNRYESLLTETYYWTSDAKLYLGGGTPSIYSKCACDEYHCTTLTFMDFPKDQFKSVRCIRKKLNP